jgi:hypothetical protein
MASGCTTPRQAKHLGPDAAMRFRHTVAALLQRWKPSAFHEGKRQTVPGDAHGGGEVGMRNMWELRYANGAATDQLQIQKGIGYRNNVRRRHCVCLEGRADGRIHSCEDCAAVANCNGLLGVVEEEQRTEALASVSPGDNMKNLEQDRLVDNVLEELTFVTSQGGA